MADAFGIDRNPVTILSGQSLSPAIPLGARSLVGLFMPAGWDAAALSFQTSNDGVTWVELFTEGGVAKSVAVAAGNYVMLAAGDWRGVVLLKIRSGSVGVPVAQSADRLLTLIQRSNMA